MSSSDQSSLDLAFEEVKANNGRLNLGCLELSSAELTAVAERLMTRERRKPLVHVDVSANGLGADCVGALGSLMAFVDPEGQAFSLNVAENFIGDGGLAGLLGLLLRVRERVRSLRLGRCGLGQASFEALSEQLGQFPELVLLDLRHNDLSEVAELGGLLGAGLESLLLSNCQLSQEGIAHLAERLGGDAALCKLELDSNAISNESARALCLAVGLNSSLKGLQLSSCHLAQGASLLLDALRANEVLTHLDLRSNEINDIAAENLAAGLAENRALLFLDLASNFISNRGIACLASALRTNSTLQYLMLDRNRCSDGGVLALAEALPANSTLLHLALDQNQITSAGGTHLATALLSNAGLTHLSSCSNPLGDDCAEAFSRSLSHNSFLKSLHLDTCELSLTGVRLILDALTTNSTLTSLALGSLHRQGFDAQVLSSIYCQLSGNPSLLKLRIPVGNSTFMPLLHRNKANQRNLETTLFMLLMERDVLMFDLDEK